MRQSLLLSSSPQVPPAFGAPAIGVFISGTALDNRGIQVVDLEVPVSRQEQWSSFESYVLTILRNRFAHSGPQARLSLLKRQRFTTDGRDARVSASLAALNRPPVFPAETDWKRTAESSEYDEED